MIYLDNAATTKIDEDVLSSMIPYLKEEYGNPGGVYKFGRDAKEAIESAREMVASFMHTTPEHILFTSGGSEGNNTVIQSYRCGGVYCSSIEHDSIIKLLASVGCTGIVNPEANGEVISESVLRTIHGVKRTPDIVSIMYVNNETGVKNDIKKISDAVKNEYHGCMIHSDCVQAAGNYEIDVDLLGLDFATISSHKIHGPKGVGAIYARDVSKIKPIIFGGSNQEYGKRAGTENVAGIVGFGKACEIAKNNIGFCKEHYKKLQDIFIRQISSELVDVLYINGNPCNDSKTINIGINGVDAETLILSLDREICMSAGSACCSLDLAPSHVLKAMGVPDNKCRGSFRVSFSKYTTEEEVEQAARLIIDKAYMLLGVD